MVLSIQMQTTVLNIMVHYVVIAHSHVPCDVSIVKGADW